MNLKEMKHIKEIKAHDCFNDDYFVMSDFEGKDKFLEEVQKRLKGGNIVELVFFPTE